MNILATFLRKFRVYFLCMFSLVSLGLLKGQDSSKGNDSLLIEYYYGKAKHFQSKDSLQLALVYYDSAQVVCRRKGKLERWIKIHLHANYLHRKKIGFASAAQYLESILPQIWETENDGDKFLIAWAYLQCGYDYYKSNDFVASADKYIYALRLYKAICPDENFYTCSGPIPMAMYLYFPLSLAYLKIGDADAAINLLENKLLNELENSHVINKQKPDILAELILTKGRAYIMRGDTMEALTCFKRACDLPDLSQEIKIKTTYSLANAFRMNLDYSDAEYYLKKAIQQANTVKNGKVKNTSLEYIHLYWAYLYRDRQEYAKAELQANRSLTYTKSYTGGIISPNNSRVYFLLGELASLQGRYPEAQQYFQYHLQCLIPEVGVENTENLPAKEQLIPSTDVMYTLDGKATAWVKAYQANSSSIILLENALSAYKLMLYTEDLVRKHQRYETSKLTLARKKREKMNNAVWAANKLWKETQDPVYLEDAFFFMEKSRATELQASIHKKFIFQDNPILDSLFRRASLARLSWYTAQQQLSEQANLFTQKANSTNTELEKKVAEYRNIYFELNSRLQDSLIHSGSNYQKWESMTKPVPLKKLQQSLTKRTMLLSFFKGEKSLFILYILKNSFFIEEMELTREHYQSLERLREFLHTSDPGQLEIREYTSLGYKWYKNLLGPLKGKGVKELIVVSDPFLHDLPIETLLTKPFLSRERKMVDFRQLSYAWQTYEIQYNYSATLASLAMNSSDPVNDYSVTYAGFAPDYSSSTEAPKDAFRAQFGQLPNNKFEIERTAAIFTQDRMPTQTFLADQATESAFVNIAPHSRIIHLSAHGWMVDTLSEFSCFLLSEEYGSVVSDGRLHEFEIQRLKLNSELAILGGCETGLGRASAGEGIISLGRAFRIAGIHNTLMSLWEIGDQTSSEFIPEFVRALGQGQGKAAALNQARESFIFNSKVGNADVAPYHWAPFVLYGNNNPLGIYSGNTNNWWAWIVVFLLVLLVALAWWIKNRKSNS